MDAWRGDVSVLLFDSASGFIDSRSSSQNIVAPHRTSMVFDSMVILCAVLVGAVFASGFALGVMLRPVPKLPVLYCDDPRRVKTSGVRGRA